jgi:hypothetical protein
MPLDIFPFKYVAVLRGQSVERDLDQAQCLCALVGSLRTVLKCCLEGIDRRLNLGEVLDEYNMVAIPSLAAKPVTDLGTARVNVICTTSRAPSGSSDKRAIANL